MILRLTMLKNRRIEAVEAESLPNTMYKTWVSVIPKLGNDPWLLILQQHYKITSIYSCRGHFQTCTVFKLDQRECEDWLDIANYGESNSLLLKMYYMYMSVWESSSKPERVGEWETAIAHSLRVLLPIIFLTGTPHCSHIDCSSIDCTSAC